MPEPIANVIVLVFAGYLAIGGVFAIAFLIVGVGRLDAAARGAGLRFRLLIAPGCAALWPVLLLRWLGAKGRPTEAHP